MAINILNHIINIDLANSININQSINIKKNDANSHKFIITIFNNSLAYDLTGYTARIYFQKADTTKVFADCVIDSATDGKVSYILETQCVSCTGLVATEVTIYGTTSEILTSITFDFNVTEVIRDDSAIESTSEFTALSTALTSIQATIDGIVNINDLNASLLSNISTGNATDGKLVTDIATGNSLDTTLKADISTGNTSHSTLQADISQAASGAFATEITNGRQGYATLLANLQAKDTLIGSVSNSLYINVKNFGAKGDGVTDDTAAIQAAINSVNTPIEGGVIFFPSTEKPYMASSSIVIPNNRADLKFLGTGIVHSVIHSTALVVFSIKCNGFCVESMLVQGPGINSVGSIMFSDDRYLNTTADNTDNLDITLNNNYLCEIERVLVTRGHGVIMFGNCFYDIHNYIIDADFPASGTFVPNGTNNDLRQTGFRGFMFRNNRVHFSPCCILQEI
ncbi:MAG TPA: BppU family phage baseplate upper protein [Clostridium sp.]